MTLFHHVLVPIDGSTHAQHALELALELARAMPRRIEVLHVIDPVTVREVSRFTGKSIDQVREEFRNRAQGILNDAVALAQRAGFEITTRVEEGIPYEAIVEYARRQGVDLIVMGRVGTRGPRRILVGSVTERVMETAPCHLLVVR